MQKYPLYINGQEDPPATGEWFETFDPFTGAPWALIAKASTEDVDRAVQAAHAQYAHGEWSRLSPTQRGALLRKLGDLLARDAEMLAQLEVRDNGKLISEMSSQLHYLPQWYYYFGGLADKVEGAVPPLDKKGYFHFTRHEPLGVVAAITPWNSPLLLLSWKLAPALAAGCTVVVKPSEFTSVSTVEFVKLFAEAGFPPGVVNVVTGFGKDVGAALVEHPLVRKVTFTGADNTGRLIGEKAARQFKSVNLELGGKSPNIVFEDADLDEAVQGAVSGIFASTGQTCIAGSRLLLHKSIHDAFLERLVVFARAARMGDPQLRSTQVGPVTTRQQFEKIEHYVSIAKSEGAQLALGGHPATRAECGSGWFFEPTIFTGVDNQMRIAQEEVFGPVLSVIPFDDEEDALRISNNSRYGLAAGVWTRDFGRMMRMSEQLQAGTVWINTYRAVSFMAQFGGYKDSGVGRENGLGAIHEYLETKSVWINFQAATNNAFIIR